MYVSIDLSDILIDGQGQKVKTKKKKKLNQPNPCSMLESYFTKQFRTILYR